MSKCLQFRFHALGTWNHVMLYDYYNQSVANQIVERVQEIDNLMSAYKVDSDVSRIVSKSRNVITPSDKKSIISKERITNISQSKDTNVSISTDTLQVLEHAKWFHRISGGAFDVTIRPLTKLWGIGKKNSYIPPWELVKEAIEKVDSSKIFIDKSQSIARFAIEGGAIDLGGIAKGYAADEVKRIIRENGIASAMINLGGNIVTVGKKIDGTSWRVGIQNPLAPRGNYLGVVEANDRTVVTSGSYEQFFIKDKVRYHHIIDPRTGYPAQSSLYSVTAICENSIDADALTTSLFVLGYEEGMKLVNQVGADAIFITDIMEVKMTKNLSDKLQWKYTNDRNRRSLYVC